MAHWFHRNVLKATTNEKFELKIANSTDATRKLCSDLKLSRARLLDLIKNANNSSDSINPAFLSYLSLLYGFLWEIRSSEEEAQHVGRPDPSKLRNVLVFAWTHTLLGGNTYSAADAVYEAANMSVNIGLWFMKHAAMIAAKDDITMNEAKDVHSMLRRAAGIFTFVQTEFLPQLSKPPPLGSDLDPRVLNAYVNQCTAEAQEVTVARAVELKHNASLISALANETSLVSPIDFQMPSPSSTWNLKTYRVLTGVTPAKPKKEQTLPPVKEEAIHQSSKEPKNESGCVLQ